MSTQFGAWKLWDPHQKLWNRQLVDICQGLFGSGLAGRSAAMAVICADSLFLILRVSTRRLRHLRYCWRNRSSRRSAAQWRPVLYIDCGVHKRAEQVRWMQRWFGGRYDLHVLGIEASGEHIRDATAALEKFDRVRLRQTALVGPSHEGRNVRLYKSADDGKGDSLYGADTEYDLVPASRLSRILAEEGYDLTQTPVLLRMNIEGAEQFVIEDLVEAGLDHYIDGFYGMWDDLAKIDPLADRQFRMVLRSRRISSLTFNDRDLLTTQDVAHLQPALQRLLARIATAVVFGLRQCAIRTDIETTIRIGQARVASANSRHHVAESEIEMPL